MKKSLSFQIIDARDYFEPSPNRDHRGNPVWWYVIRLFGRTALDDPHYPDKSVCVTLKDYQPFFYISYPPGLALQSFSNHLRLKFRGFVKHEIVHLYDFDGFQGETKAPFIQLVFNSVREMRRVLDYLSSGYKGATFKFYESNVAPLLRFMHQRSIRGASWACIDWEYLEESINEYDIAFSKCDVDVVTDWHRTGPDNEKNEKGHYSRLRILAFDIETMSTDPHGGFPQASREGDEIIQIGMTFNYYHKRECYKKIILVLGGCTPVPDADVIVCSSEEEMTTTFLEILCREDPDVITGYNTFGFDNRYMHDRVQRMSVATQNMFSRWGRLSDEFNGRYIEKTLVSSALGENIMHYYDSHGRIQIDLLKVIQRDHRLDTYKLDLVAAHFNQHDMNDLSPDDCTQFTTSDISGLEEKGFFMVKTVDKTNGVEDLYGDYKFQINSIKSLDKTKWAVTFSDPNKWMSQKILKDFDKTITRVRWCMAKDDLPAKKIFEFHLKGDEERAVIAKYCIKDCVLVNYLMERLDILSTNIAMANVCWVPLSFVFTRGQGVKIFSLVVRESQLHSYVIPAISKSDFTDNLYCSEELPPPSEKKPAKVGKGCSFDGCPSHTSDESFNPTIYVYKEEGVEVCSVCKRVQYYTGYDGARVFTPEPSVFHQPISVLDYASLYPRSIISYNISWETQVLDHGKYGSLPGYVYRKVTYREGTLSRSSYTECTFAQKETGELGIIPLILTNLLEERTLTRKRMKSETDNFRKKVMDGHQLALKITANSLYGQCGAITSPLYRKALAACTTAVGQQMLEVARQFVEEEFEDELIRLSNREGPDSFATKFLMKYSIRPSVVYGDTDSVFVNYNIQDRDTGEVLTDRTARELSIAMGKLSADMIRPKLMPPHDLEYEKTFHPWLILCKKKYAGQKYENDPDKSYMSHMGIVLKRRDNAKIVKKVCGGILHLVLHEKDSSKIAEYTQKILTDVVGGIYDLSYFVTTKRLKDFGSYADFRRVAHAYLAYRMQERDPGSAPQPNDRLSYVQVYDKKKANNKSLLQGDRIEEVSYVETNKLPVDYFYYIDRQIKQPACQFLSLVMENPEKNIFLPVLRTIELERSNTRPISHYFGVKK